MAVAAPTGQLPPRKGPRPSTQLSPSPPTPSGSVTGKLHQGDQPWPPRHHGDAPGSLPRDSEHPPRARGNAQQCRGCTHTHTRVQSETHSLRHAQRETHSEAHAHRPGPHLTAQSWVVLRLWVKVRVSLTLGLSSLCVEGSGTLNGSAKETGLVSASERLFNRLPPCPTYGHELSFIHSTNSTCIAGH